VITGTPSSRCGKGAGLSRSTVSQANGQTAQRFETWRRRNLSADELSYLFLDGPCEGVRLGAVEKEAILVAHGITKKGARGLLVLRP